MFHSRKFWPLNLLMLGVGLAASFAQGQEPAPAPALPPSKEAVRLECHMFTLPQAEFLELLPTLENRQQREQGWETLMDLVTAGKAHLLILAALPTTLGQRAMFEAIDEVRFANAYAPPQLPQGVPADKMIEALRNWPLKGVTPTEFGTRKVGITMEASIERQGDLYRVEATPSHVRLLRMDKGEVGRIATGEKLMIEQPIFHVMKSQVTLPMRPGEHVLAATYRVPGTEKPQFEIHILRLLVE